MLLLVSAVPDAEATDADAGVGAGATDAGADYHIVASVTTNSYCNQIKFLLLPEKTSANTIEQLEEVVPCESILLLVADTTVFRGV